MTTLRQPIDRRRIVWDARPIARGRDDGPLEARAALTDHARRSMGADAFAKWLTLLDYYDRANTGLGGESEGESSAMDSRVLDHGASSLAKMFPDAKAPPRV